MYECDMHTHTRRSDGYLTPLESIDRAVERGLKVLVISDHDTILPLMYEMEESAGEILNDITTGRRFVNLVEYAAERGLELVRGIEISCDTENEDVHLVGIFCDWDSPEFEQLEKDVRLSRVNSYRKIIENLALAGYEVSWEDFLRDVERVNDPENTYKKQIYEYLDRKGYVSDWRAGRRLIQSRPEFNLGREKPDPVEMIRLIHKTGGKVIQAHPFLVKEQPCYKGKTMSRFEYIDMLIEAGLDGIEACYPYEKTSYSGVFSREEIEKQVRERYADAGIFFSGGSDFHGDYVAGVQNPRELGECGISYKYYCSHVRKLGQE